MININNRLIVPFICKDVLDTTLICKVKYHNYSKVNSYLYTFSQFEFMNEIYILPKNNVFK